MQSTINSYNLYRIPSTNVDQAYNGSFQIIIGAGVFDIDGSNVQIDFGGVTSSVATNKFLARADCFVGAQAPTIITKDGIQLGQYLNLTAAQLGFAQDNSDFIGLLNDTAYTASTGCNSVKQWTKLGSNADTTVAQKVSKCFQLRHFFPYIFNENDKYFSVDSIMNITMNLNSGLQITSTTNAGATAVATTLSNPLITLIAQQASNNGGSLSNVVTCTNLNIFINLKRVTNQVEQAKASISPHITCFLQQAQSIGSGVTFNQSFGQNQISQKQQQVFLYPPGYNIGNYPVGAANAVQIGNQTGTQFYLDDYIDNTAGTLNIQRMGVNIVNASSSYEAKCQLQLQKSNKERDFNNYIVTFDTLLNNTNVQTLISSVAKPVSGSTITQGTGGNLSTTETSMIGYLGYCYITQLQQMV